MNPYVPDKLPIESLDFGRLIKLVGEANSELSRYDGLLQGIVNPSVLLSPLTTNEAVLSSKIEGTQATLDEVLEHEAGINSGGEKEKDIQEIVNYREALISAEDVLTDYPVSLHIIREIHKILLNSVRGENKTPGEFRKDQNWIGKAGCSIENASFVPPSPMILTDSLREWEDYMKGDDVDVLIQLAVVHAQFELIHPFKDGNGRIGRLLIPLFLFSKKRLIRPMFYLSEYLENRREEYYQRLSDISGSRDWNGWIEFFLKAIKIQAINNSLKVKRILLLYEEMKQKITETTHSQYSLQILDAIFDKPIFKTVDFMARTGITKQTGLKLLKQIKDAGIIQELKPASGRRPAVLAFGELINIVEGKNVF